MPPLLGHGLGGLAKEGGGDEAEEENRKPHLAAAEVDTLLLSERSQGHSQHLPQLIIHIHRMKCNILLPQTCAPSGSGSSSRDWGPLELRAGTSQPFPYFPTSHQERSMREGLQAQI